MATAKPHVVLISPDGDETTASTPTAVNNLVYGANYKVKSGTVDEAIAKVQANVTGQGATVEKQTAQGASPTADKQK